MGVCGSSTTKPAPPSTPVRPSAAQTQPMRLEGTAAEMSYTRLAHGSRELQAPLAASAATGAVGTAVADAVGIAAVAKAEDEVMAKMAPAAVFMPPTFVVAVAMAETSSIEDGRQELSEPPRGTFFLEKPPWSTTAVDEPPWGTIVVDEPASALPAEEAAP
mmetsp:Transcript_128916/g.334229  ORF Transcript_128916/g.334229 Transcript_128916/m.334229 type:complete len:161 (-) Transcript_128916:415-897(-)